MRQLLPERSTSSGKLRLRLTIFAACAALVGSTLVGATVGASGGGGGNAVTFRESGLPRGSSWSVTLNGTPESSTTATIVFHVPAGHYSLSMGSPAGYGLAHLGGPGVPTQGSVNISGPSLFTASFGKLETLSFEETGLPSHSSWNVSIRSDWAHGGPASQYRNATLPAPIVAAVNDFSGSSPEAIAFDPQNGLLYVANSNASNVTVINGTTNAVARSIPVGVNPDAVAYDSANRRVYVANYGSANLSVIDGSTNSVVRSIPVGYNPSGIAVDSASGRVYVTNQGSWNISVVNGSTNAVATSIPATNGPGGIAFDPTSGNLYVAEFDASKVAIIDPANGTTLRSLSVVAQPWGIAFDPANGDVYVTSWGSNAMTVINTATEHLVRNLNVGGPTTGVLYCPADGLIWAANDASSALLGIEGTTQAVVTSVTVGYDPTGLAYDPATGSLYAADEGNDSVSAAAISLLTAGLSVNFTVVEGAWHYRAAPGSNTYRATPGLGNVQVGRAGAVRVVPFRPVTERVIFIEVGLPLRYIAALAVWVTGSPSPHLFGPFSARGPLVFHLQNGTYNFSVFLPNASYTPSPASGSFTVSVPSTPGRIVFVVRWQPT
jgi:YVTN family beta-propeller protein